jgi:hypothetical protein
VPLCTRHHDQIHHHGWVLHIDDHRNVTWTAPDGARLDVPFRGLVDTQPTLFGPEPNTAA